MKKVLAGLNVQKNIVTLCFLLVCLGTQQMQTKAWNSGWIEFSRDAVGVWMAIIIMTHYKWNDFVANRITYLIWTVVGVVGMAIGIPLVITKRPDYLVADTVIIALGIFLMGYCVIHTIISFVIEKRRPRYYKPLLFVWLIMMLWMIFSKTEYWWPECYFVLFLCYYLTEPTDEQRENVAAGLVDGIILGFLAIQGHSFLCRPYELPRYVGNFCNPNHNAMFLCMCLAAILAKILMGIKEKRSKWLQMFFYLMAATCYSFIFMTGSRSAYMTVLVVTIFFLLGYCRIKQKRVFFRMGLLLVTLFITIMPLTYLSVRYLPTIHPHVIFYFQEGYSEERVHSWDPRDSEKYVSFEEMTDIMWVRFKLLLKALNINTANMNFVNNTNMCLVSNADHLPKSVLTSRVAVLEQDPNKIPLITEKMATNAMRTRYYIYKWYYDHLSLRGMPYDEQGFQLTESHWIQDTHNIYLDYGINFGWPVMILFTVFIWWGNGRLIIRGLKARSVEKLTYLLIALIPPIFGIFEFSWGAGMLSTVAFYLSFKEMFADS